jgi:hypothetical protein
MNFFGKPTLKEELTEDFNGLSPDIIMGPDWFCYRSDRPEISAQRIKKAIDLNMEFIGYENFVPTIRGNYCQETKRFVEPFKKLGKNWFVFTGREYLVNRGDRKRSELAIASITSTLAREEKIKLIVTGCSSPRQQEKLKYVAGFAGLSWLIRSREKVTQGKKLLHFPTQLFLQRPDLLSLISKTNFGKKKRRTKTSNS